MRCAMVVAIGSLWATLAEAQAAVPLTTAQIAKRAVPATAMILTFGAQGDTISQGSGFVIERTGIVVTNWHVLAGASRAAIHFPSGEVFDWVRYLAGDSLADIVLLKFPGYELPTLPTTSVVPDPGEKVVAIGSPLGLSETVSEGIVSAVRVVGGRQLVQITAAISSGSSGGPVLDDRGRVIAVATSQLKVGQQLNFAVPIRYALALLQDPSTPRSLDSVFAAAPAAVAQADTDAGGTERRTGDELNRMLGEAQALVQERRAPEAASILEVVVARGDVEQRENAAALLYTGGAGLLQKPQNLEGAAALLRRATAVAHPAGKVAAAAHYLLGLATLFQVPELDRPAEKQKSCALAQQMAALLAEAETALVRGRSTNAEVVDKNLGIIRQYRPRVGSMLNSYC